MRTLTMTLTMIAVSPAAATPGQEPTARVLTVATKETPPFVVRDGDGWTGLSIELWRLLEPRLGVTSRFVERDLQGMLDGVADGTVDLALAAITMTPDREEQIDFTHPFLNSGLGIATRGREEGMLTALLARVFSLDLLRALFALFVVLTGCGLLVWLFERRANPDQFGGKGLAGPGAGFWFSAVTMTTVGYGDKAPMTLGGRVVALVWMFASIIVISGYTASIASALTVDRMSAVIRGPEDLPGARIGTLTGSAATRWLQERRLAFSGYADLRQAFDDLEQSRLDAIVYDAPILSSMTAGSDTLRVLPHILRQEQYAIALPRGSELREPVNTALLELLQTEQWSSLRTRYLGN